MLNTIKEILAMPKQIENLTKAVEDLKAEVSLRNAWKNQSLFCAENKIGKQTLDALVQSGRVECFNLTSTQKKYRWVM